jgi:hypothetical protein
MRRGREGGDRNQHGHAYPAERRGMEREQIDAKRGERGEAIRLDLSDIPGQSREDDEPHADGEEAGERQARGDHARDLRHHESRCRRLDDRDGPQAPGRARVAQEQRIERRAFLDEHPAQALQQIGAGVVENDREAVP